MSKTPIDATCKEPIITTHELIGRMRSHMQQKDNPLDVLRQGTVLRISDGVAFCDGLSDCVYNEKLIFKGGVVGMALNLEKDQVGAILFGDYTHIEAGDIVYRTGELVKVPAGHGLLGRVVDALGKPIDDGGAVQPQAFRSIGAEAPEILMRKPVTEPLETGILAIDSMIPIGRGQRELIIGDRQTGKTTIALDTILNQQGKKVICVYVAIGQKESSVRSIAQKLKDKGAMAYTIIVAAMAGDPTAMQYIAPYAGCAIAEFYMHRGMDVLIVYDDLSKHAVAYRELSLLLKRPPGREAFPGDVFYLHSRLLERSARLSDSKGGGSLTALPIVETQFGDVASYIPTNVISITDGQIFLESDLFHAGQRPAVNVGISVSRVGGAAQIQAMKKVAGRLRIDLAQYRELQAFTQFGADLDADTKQKLARGAAITALLKQPPASPYSHDQMVALIVAGENGIFDNLTEAHVKQKAEAWLNFYGRSEFQESRETILQTGRYTPEVEKTMQEALTRFNKEEYA